MQLGFAAKGDDNRSKPLAAEETGDATGEAILIELLTADGEGNGDWDCRLEVVN